MLIRSVCRELMEQSSACLCPSVAYQLAGAKKVQQDLAQGSVLQRFTKSREDAELLQACFAGVAFSDQLNMVAFIQSLAA